MNLMEHRHILAESKHYQVSHEFETVFLIRKSNLFTKPNPEIIVGDFYGDPAAAVIDEQERFVIMAGCGLIIYNLVEPFEPYRYHVQTQQWVDLFREKQKIWWIESLSQHDARTFYFAVDAHSEEGGTYQLTLPDLAIQRLT